MNFQDQEFQYMEGPWRFSGGDIKGHEYRIRIEIQPQFMQVFQQFRDGEFILLAEFPIEMLADVAPMLSLLLQDLSSPQFVPCGCSALN